MVWQQIGTLLTLYVRGARQQWVDLTREELHSTHRQLEQLIDCVCNRHSVARITVEHEIYDGLQRIGARNASSGANAYREDRRL
jgi:hypothetical protein